MLLSVSYPLRSRRDRMLIASIPVVLAKVPANRSSVSERTRTAFNQSLSSDEDLLTAPELLQNSFHPLPIVYLGKDAEGRSSAHQTLEVSAITRRAKKPSDELQLR